MVSINYRWMAQGYYRLVSKYLSINYNHKRSNRVLSGIISKQLLAMAAWRFCFFQILKAETLSCSVYKMGFLI